MGEQSAEMTEVIPVEENERLARAECPQCGWRGKSRRWWSDAQADADRHNGAGCIGLTTPEDPLGRSKSPHTPPSAARP